MEQLLERIPAHRGWYGVTAPVFSTDSTRALVYVEYHCGWLCGQGELRLLDRSASGSWRVVRRLRYWVS